MPQTEARKKWCPLVRTYGLDRQGLWPKASSPGGEMNTPLGAMTGHRAPAVWHKQRILVLPLEEIIDPRTRDMLNNIARKLYGG